MSSAAARARLLARKGRPSKPARIARRARFPLHEASPLRDALPLWRIGVMAPPLLGERFDPILNSRTRIPRERFFLALSGSAAGFAVTRVDRARSDTMFAAVL